MRDPERLRVWQSAMTMAELVYDATRKLPSDERYGLVAQLRRSAVSVASNIAEGCGRRTKREFAHFLAIAAGSLHEVNTQVLIAVRTGIMPADETLASAIQDTKGQLVVLRSLIEDDLRTE